MVHTDTLDCLHFIVFIFYILLILLYSLQETGGCLHRETCEVDDGCGVCLRTDREDQRVEVRGKGPRQMESLDTSNDVESVVP